MQKFKRGIQINYHYKNDEIIRHPINRDAVFMRLCNDFKKRYPYLKLIYAYLNPRPLERLQYLLIFKYVSESVNERNEILTKYIVICANTFSLTSLEGYDIAISRMATDAWFEDVLKTPATYPEGFFKDIINRSDDLTFNKNSKHPEKYWKDPKNAEKLIKHLDGYATTFYNSLLTRRG